MINKTHVKNTKCRRITEYLTFSFLFFFCLFFLILEYNSTWFSHIRHYLTGICPVTDLVISFKQSVQSSFQFIEDLPYVVTARPNGLNVRVLQYQLLLPFPCVIDFFIFLNICSPFFKINENLNSLVYIINVCQLE